jgi:hypothetical protein
MHKSDSHARFRAPRSQSNRGHQTQVRTKRAGRLTTGLVVSLVVLPGCGSAPDAGAQGTGFSPLTAYSCVYQTREVQHCGGATPVNDWMPYCDSRPCPIFLDIHNRQYGDLAGESITGTCSTSTEYREVFDFQGSCDEWTQEGQPLAPPKPIYCGHSLIYNEFSEGHSLGPYCNNCAQDNCPNEYATCCPDLTSCAANDCDSLIRCLRKCEAGDAAAERACMQAFPDGVQAAQALATCLTTSCFDTCD